MGIHETHNRSIHDSEVLIRPFAPLSISERLRFFTSQPLVRSAMIGMVVLLIVGYYFAARPEETNQVVFKKVSTSQSTVTSAPSIKVYVEGAVLSPGVVTISSGARIQDAIDAAGGVTQAAVLSHCNLAAFVVDGESVFIPSIGEPGCKDNGLESTSMSNPGEQSDSVVPTKINLNTATKAELELLPGVGPTLAESILSYRKQVGRFKTVSDLQKVKGIGEKRFADLKDLVTT